MTAAVDLVKRTCAAQGLPEQVTDVAVLARVAALARVSAPGTKSEGTAKTVSARQGRGGRRGC